MRTQSWVREVFKKKDRDSKRGHNFKKGTLSTKIEYYQEYIWFVNE